MPFDGIPPASLAPADIPAQGVAAPIFKNSDPVQPDFGAQFRPAAAARQAAMQSASFMPFIYKQPENQKKKGIFGIEYPKFDVESSLASFYASFRLVGYICDPMYSVAKKRFQNFQEDSEKIVNKIFRQSSTVAANDLAKASTVQKAHYYAYKLTKVQPTHFLNIVETAAFFALARHYTKKDRRDLHTNLDLAVAGERGIVSDVLPDKDLWESKNPIVESAMDRHKWQTRMRHGAAPFFLAGLPWGILANAFVITAERTAFYRPIAYDVLKKAVTDVQVHNLDSQLAKDRLTDDLIKVLQQQRMDHRQPVIPHKQIHAIRPVLETIAQDVIDKKFGFAGMIYIMGGGVIVPEDPEQTRINYEHVRQVGVSGIAREGKIIQEQLKVGPARTWEAHIAAQRAETVETNDRGRGSASRESVLRQRQELLAKGPVHSGAVQDGRRGSAGLAL
jgi:hypothetical protein